jgi:hypothetical protein
MHQTILGGHGIFQVFAANKSLVCSDRFLIHNDYMGCPR